MHVRDRVVEFARIDPALIDPHPKNYRRHPEAQRTALRAVLDEIGYAGALIAVKRGDRYTLCDGHLRRDEATGPVPVLVVDLSDAEVDKLLASFDALGSMAQPDQAAWKELLSSLDSQTDPMRAALSAMGTSLGFGPKGNDGATARALVDQFLVPPFTVLDARQGYWQDRKRQWISLGIESEVGRTAKAFYTGGHAESISDQPTTSIFDPVLCELVYRWFSPAGGTVLDPFAGGSVRGIVASILGRRYTGLDLRPEQVAANTAQAAALPNQRPPEATPAKAPPPDLEITAEWSAPTPSDVATQAACTAKAAFDQVTPHYKAALMSRLPLAAYKEHAEKGQIRLAVVRGSVVGMVMVSPSPKAGRLKLVQICRKDDAPPGTGAALLAWAIAQAKAANLPRVELAVRSHNQHAIDFYTRAGFVQIDTEGQNLILSLPVAGDPPSMPQAPRWQQGDARNVLALVDGQYDLLFTCPPYGDLERYSDPLDLSTLEYGDFAAAHRLVIARAATKLKPNRFAVWVVGNFRDPAGNLRDFVGDTVAAFRDAGLNLYNDGILVTAVGSLPLRTGRQFNHSRKLGRTHQTVLVFVKGDAVKATEAAGKVEVGEV